MITTIFGLRRTRLNGIITSPYQEATLETFDFLVGAHLAAWRAVFWPQKIVTFKMVHQKFKFFCVDSVVPKPNFGPKISAFLRYTHITTFFGLRGLLFNRIISPPYPVVTLDTFGFPVGGRLAAQRPVFLPKVTFERPHIQKNPKIIVF